MTDEQNSQNNVTFASLYTVLSDICILYIIFVTSIQSQLSDEYRLHNLSFLHSEL
jgi:hypothetical protein